MITMFKLLTCILIHCHQYQPDILFNFYFILAVMDAIDETRQRTFYVALTFSDKVANKDYAMTGNGKEQDITALVSNESVYLCV